MVLIFENNNVLIIFHSLRGPKIRPFQKFQQSGKGEARTGWSDVDRQRATKRPAQITQFRSNLLKRM